MIEFVTLAVGVLVGWKIRRAVGWKNSSRSRCGAIDRVGEKYYNYGIETRWIKLKCKEPSDRRCQADNCTKHCRDKTRCDGICLKEIA